MDVVKQSGANTVDVADGVQEAVRQINTELPPHIRLRRLGTARSSYGLGRDVKVTLLLGGALTVLIVFLFLNSWRSTVITGWPCRCRSSALSSSCGPRFTLNILTLMGLSWRSAC